MTYDHDQRQHATARHKTMRVLFVRHGQSTANAAGTIGTPDTPLTDQGAAQAKITAAELRNQNITQIVCSPFARARQTAEIIAEELGISPHDIIIVAELRERYMGDLIGKPKNHPTSYFYDNDTENNFESRAALIERMQKALSEIAAIARARSGTTLVVGHGASGFYLLQIAKGKKHFREFEPSYQLDNARFVELNLL